MRTTIVGVLIASSLALSSSAGCKKAPVEQKDNSAAEAREKEEEEKAALEKADRAAKKKAAAEAKAKVDDALKAFGSAPNAEKRRETYLAVLDALTQAKAAMDVSVFKSLPVAAATPFFDRLTVIRAEEVADDKDAPNIPVKPEHDPPKYDGAFALSGQVRKCYKDGVLLESRGKFYVVSNADCPDTTSLYGVVEPTGKTLDVDIGRDGREAEVVTVSNKETERDDRIAHRKALVDYETDYRDKLKDYYAATNGKEAVVAALEKRRSARKAERETLWKSVDTLLLPVAKAVADGKALDKVTLPSVAAPSASTQTTATAPIVAVVPAAAAAPPAVTVAPTPSAPPTTGGGWQKPKCKTLDECTGKGSGGSVPAEAPATATTKSRGLANDPY
jgi:hypothetical protein